MSTFLHVVLWVVVAAVVLWAIVFGGIGVAIARVRGKSLGSGFAWGFLLGPIGWLVLLIARRDGVRERRQRPADDQEFAGGSEPGTEEAPEETPDVL